MTLSSCTDVQISIVRLARKKLEDRVLALSVAVRILQMVEGREKSDLPASLTFSEQQQQCLAELSSNWSLDKVIGSERSAIEPDRSVGEAEKALPNSVAHGKFL